MKRVYIPPQPGAVRQRPVLPTKPVIAPDTVMNCMQFVATLKHTEEEIFSMLVNRTCGTFQGTYTDWQAKLQELKDAPAF